MDLNKFKLTGMLNASRGKTFVGPAPRPGPGWPGARVAIATKISFITKLLKFGGNFIKSILKTDFRQHKNIAIVTN